MENKYAIRKNWLERKRFRSRIINVREFLNYEDKAYKRKLIMVKVSQAIKKRVLIRENAIAHHWSYTKENWLNIVWLNRLDHIKIHTLCKKLNWFWDV